MSNVNSNFAAGLKSLALERVSAADHSVGEWIVVGPRHRVAGGDGDGGLDEGEVGDADGIGHCRTSLSRRVRRCNR